MKSLISHCRFCAAFLSVALVRLTLAATDFIACANIVDPETPADQAVTADEPLRRAWSDALVHAARLDHLTDMLCHAAELCGVTVGWHPFDGGTLALVTEPGASGRAELFAAWQTTIGRAARWAALLRVGAKIRAHPLDEDFKPYHPDDDKPKVIEPIDPRRPSKRAVIA